jgi:hypothetical protein
MRLAMCHLGMHMEAAFLADFGVVMAAVLQGI